MPIPAIRAIAIESLKFIYGTRGFLKDELPTEASGAQKFTQEFGRRACRKYARARGTLAGVSYSPIWSTVCDPYLDSINEGPTTGGSYGPLYPGGQCAVAYRWNTISKRYNPNTGQLVQEITGTAGDYLGPLTWSVLPDIVSFGDTISRRQVTYNGGNLVYFVKEVNQYGQLESTYEIENIRRADGQPDNCGNQPDNNYTPPSFPPNLPSLPTPTNPAPGFGNNWEVNILPDGKVQFCLASDCSDGVPPNGGGGPDSGGGPGEPDGDPQETDPNDPNNPNEVSGCVEDDRLLTGLKIEVTQAPPNYQGLGTIYYRSCWVWMGPGLDLLDMVIDGRTLESGQFVIPDNDDCTCFKVRANPGFKVSVQAYSRPKEE